MIDSALKITSQEIGKPLYMVIKGQECHITFNPPNPYSTEYNGFLVEQIGFVVDESGRLIKDRHMKYITGDEGWYKEIV